MDIKRIKKILLMLFLILLIIPFTNVLALTVNSVDYKESLKDTTFDISSTVDGSKNLVTSYNNTGYKVYFRTTNEADTIDTSINSYKSIDTILEESIDEFKDNADFPVRPTEPTWPDGLPTVPAEFEGLSAEEKYNKYIEYLTEKSTEDGADYVQMYNNYLDLMDEYDNDCYEYETTVKEYILANIDQNRLNAQINPQEVLLRYLKSNETVTNNGVTLKIVQTKTGSGTIKIDYILTNTSESTKNFAVSTASNIDLGANNKAAIKKEGSSSILITQDDSTITGTYKAQMNISFSPSVSTSWIGNSTQTDTNRYTDGNVNAYTFVDNVDAGLAYSWSGTLSAGESITKTATYTISEAEASKVNLFKNGNSTTTPSQVINGVKGGAIQIPDSEKNVWYTKTSPVNKYNSGAGLILTENELTLYESLSIDGITFTGYNGVYDGNQHGVTITGTQSGDKVYYSTDGVTYNETEPKYSNVGTHKVYYKVTRDSYNDLLGTYEIKITSAEITNSMFSYESVTKTYDGNSYTITETGTGLSDVIKTFTVNGNTTSTLPTFKNAGTYIIEYKIEKENYTTKTGTATLIINKRNITVKANDKTITYEDSIPTFDYSITSGELVEGDKLENITISEMTNTNAGVYDITLSQTEGSNSNYAIAFEKGLFTIKQKAITPTIDVSQSEFIYNETDQRPTIIVKADDKDISSTEYEVEYPTDSINAGNKQIIITSSNLNYTFNQITANYIIKAKELTKSMISVDVTEYVYDGSAKAPKLTIKDNDKTLSKSTDYEIESSSIISATNAGDYSIIIQGKGNYQGEHAIPWTIEKGKMPGTVDGVDTIYDGNNHSISVTKPDSATITYKVDDAEEYTTTKPEFKNAGYYTVYYKIVDKNNNYYDAEGSTKVIISKKDISLTVDSKSKVYGEEDPTLTYKVNGLIDTDILEGIEITRETGENVGTYNITATKDDNNNQNYNISIENNIFTIEIKKVEEPNIILSSETMTYTGKEVKPLITVEDEDGKTIPSTEYTVTYENNIEIGIATIKIKNASNGNYLVADSSTTFEIIEKGIFELVDPKIPNANDAKINDKVEDLIKKIYFTSEEMNAINKGKNIEIYLEAKNIDNTISQEAKKLIEKELSEKYNIGTYYDINLFKQIDGNNKTNITETKDFITISLEIPEKLFDKNNTKRVFKLLRVHDGKVEVVDSNVEEKILTFKTDKFSIYALVYSDLTDINNPVTKDNVSSTMIMLIVTGIGLLSICGYTVLSKKNQ